jgi:hypothetical protein
MPRIKLTVPPEVLHTAKLASQAMDPDVGGFNAFEAPDEVTGLYSYTVDVSDGYLTAFQAFMLLPGLLRDSIARDFERRFPDTDPPTLDDCAAFVEQLQLEVIECLS